MDKLAYHYNKKKLPAKTEGKYLYYYPCADIQNATIQIGGRSFITIEVTEKEWEALMELDRQRVYRLFGRLRFSRSRKSKLHILVPKFIAKSLINKEDLLPKISEITPQMLFFEYFLQKIMLKTPILQ